MIIKFILFTLAFAVCATASNHDCFQAGECRESLHIQGDLMTDEFACLEFCQSITECSWFTFSQETNYCELFTNCTYLDSDICPQCLSGERNCTAGEANCWIQGECLGIVDFFDEQPSANDCLQLCNSTFGCRWFTFHSPSSECLLYQTCPAIDESCEACISGERRCIEESSSSTASSASSSTITTPMPAGMTKLLVASGFGFLDSVEVVNLDELNPGMTCDNLQNLPFGIEGATGQLFQGERPIICGGIKSSRWVDLCDCFELKGGSWVSIASLSECRRYASSSLSLQNGNGDELLIVAGGYSTSFRDRKSVEAFDGNEWSLEKVSPLPTNVGEHCMVRINESTLLSIGGYSKFGWTSETNFYDSISNNWYAGPNLSDTRERHACGVLHWYNPNTDQNEKVIVVAGGNNNAEYMSSTELLFLNEFETSQQGWVMGPNLPNIALSSTMTEYKNSVILVGGDYGVDGQHLYQLSSPTGTWLEMNQTLKKSRYEHVSFLVPDEIVNCH